MSKLYIGFSYPKKIKVGATAISWWTNRPYSHVYLRFTYSNSKDTIFHAAHGMVHFRSAENFLKENNVVKEYCVELSEACSDKFFDDCMELAGEDYGCVELLKIFTSDIAYSMFQKEIQFKNSRGYICSELVGTLCKDRLQLEFSKPMFLLKPGDIDFALSRKFKAI